MNKHMHMFRSVMIALYALVLVACGSATFCIGPAGKCNSNDAVVTFADADRQALIDALTGVVKAEVAAAEGRLGDKLDANEQLATDQLTALHKQLEDVTGALNAHDALSAKALRDLADGLDDLEPLNGELAKLADIVRAHADSSTPGAVWGYCRQAANGWTTYNGVNVLCWGGHVKDWNSASVTAEPWTITEVNKFQDVKNVVGKRTTIKAHDGREGTGTFYCRQPGKPNPKVGDTCWRLPNGDLWCNSQILREIGPDGPVATFTPGSPATAQASATPGGNATATQGSGGNSTATPQSGGNSNENVSIVINNDGTWTITVEGTTITINNNIVVQLQNAGIDERILQLLLAQSQWQQQILALLQNGNWSVQDIVIQIIFVVTGEVPVPGQYCIQVRTYACDLGRWFQNPCDAAAAGGRILVFNQDDCPNDVATATPNGSNPTATDRPNPTATTRPGQATATARWFETSVPTWTPVPTATQRPDQPTPAHTSVPATDQPDPTATRTATPDPDPTEEGPFLCSITTAQMAALLGIPPRELVQTGKNVRWDPCKWNVEGLTSIIFHVSLQVTARFPFEGEPIAVFYGDGIKREVIGGTVRYLPDYRRGGRPTAWVLDPCMLLVQEEAFGKAEDPAYNVYNGNLICPSFPNHVLQGPCPQTAIQAATALGGQTADWKSIGFTSWRPYWAWGFDAGHRNGVERLRSPGYGDFDTWKWGNVRGADLPGTIESATFNCR